MVLRYNEILYWNLVFKGLQLVVVPEPTSRTCFSNIEGTRYWQSISNLFLKNIKIKAHQWPDYYVCS